MIFQRKLLLSVTAILLLSLTGQAAPTWVAIGSEEPASASLTLINDALNATELDFQLAGYYQETRLINGKPYLAISAEDMTPLLRAGAPDLPKLYRSILIPDNARMTLEIEVLAYRDITLPNLLPSKGNLTRDIDPATVPYTFGSVYQQDAFYPEQIASLSNPYVLRDARGLVIQMHPFRYNPVQGTLRIYTHLRLHLSSAGPARQAIKHLSSQAVSRSFQLVYEKHFLNYGTNSVLYDLPQENGRMLIITADNYYDAVIPLMEWKRTRGLPTEIVRISDVGNNATSIKYFVQQHYIPWKD